MKKLVLLFAVVSVLIPLRSAFSQTLDDYVKQVKGDTLVIKDYSDMNNQPNSLYWGLVLDTVNVPAGRVYELQAGGVYPLNNVQFQNTALLPPLTSSALHPTVIVGSDPTTVVNNKNAGSSPPLICTDNAAWGFSLGINAGGDLTIKNCELVNTANDGRIGICFTATTTSNLHLVFDNCIFEHTAHWFVYMNIYNGSNNDSNENVTFRNCYFVNMNGQPCRRDGGVLISFNNQDTLLVENCTHIMAQGSLYKFLDSPFKKIIINHNTFINCAGSFFASLGYESNLTVTNNIFVDSNLQPASDSVLTWDAGDVDPDKLPTGLVNCAPLPASYTQMDRKILVDRNVVYWDPRFNNMDSILIANKADGTTNWVSQMIPMNSRTQALFNDNTHYPYLTEGTWYNELPHFVDPKNLLTSEVDSVRAYAMSTVSQGVGGRTALSDWRLINTGPDKHIYPDWPIPVNLAYTDADLLTGGTMGEPVGDLNWFPAQKVQWNKAAEEARLEDDLNSGVLAVKNRGTEPATYALSQNYPNPFNPTTVISFTIPNAGHATLKVYNILGQEVATLLDGFKAPQTYDLKFDGTRLASGVYTYSLKYEDMSISKKMLLLK